MARTLPLPPPGFDELSADEKIVYVQALWDRIETPLQDEPIPDWHLQIVRERLAEYEADPDSGNITMEELIAMLDEPLDSSGR